MNDGGQAFPSSDHAAGIYGTEGGYQFFGTAGMSLRDYFAAAALSGILANHCLLQNMDAYNETPAGKAYEIADDMLAAREEYQ